jgi:glycosyltransferase involved in cell wall biosynthesis
MPNRCLSLFSASPAKLKLGMKRRASNTGILFKEQISILSLLPPGHDMISPAAKTVSVIIPVHNTEKYLHRCLSGVTAQTYKALHIICINNGSTDNSMNILEEFAHADHRITVINQQDLGPSGGRKSGLRRSDGEYVYFLDSDDWIDPEYIESMVYALESNNVSLLFNKSIVKVLDGKMEQYRDCREITGNGLYQFEYTSPSLWSWIYRKDFIDSFFEKIPDNVLLEDVYIHYTFKRTQDIFYCIIGPNYYYRFHGESVMTNYIKSFDMITVVEMIHKFYKANNLLSKYHIPLELLYNKMESHAGKIEFQNKIRDLLHTIGDDIQEHSNLYHDYTAAITRAFLQSGTDEDLTPKLRKLALAGLRSNIRN